MVAVERALIVGAGMAGLTMALALKRIGVDVRIVEVRPSLTEAGTGISLQGPALRALRDVGVLDRCIERGFPQSFFKICDAEGKVTGTVELPRLLGPDYPAMVGIMRHEVHEALAAELEALGVRIHLSNTVSKLSQKEDRVSVTFVEGESEEYDLVIGADGANSLIRELTFGPGVRPRYTGQMNWRATVPRPPEITGRYSYFGRTIKSGFNPVSEEQMYIYIVQNVPDRPRWRDEELPIMLRSILQEFGGALGRARDEVTDPKQIICRPIVSMIMPAPWYHGRVVLIGDAAHTTTPQLASGASIAIEDAVVLARHLRVAGSVASALDAFMKARFDRCRMVVENSEQLGEWEKRPGTADHLVRDIVAESYRALAQEP